MKYMMLWRPAETEVTSGPPSPALMADLNGLFGEMYASGNVVMAGGLLPLQQGARVDTKGRAVVVTDGPYTETKELVAGFSIMEAASKEEAVEWARRFVQVHADHGWEGTCEVRAMIGPDGPGA